MNKEEFQVKELTSLKMSLENVKCNQNNLNNFAYSIVYLFDELFQNIEEMNRTIQYLKFQINRLEEELHAIRPEAL